MATSMAAVRANIEELKANPRRVELLKPAVMIAVNILVVVAYRVNLDNAIQATSPNDLTRVAWAVNFMGFAMFSIMPTFLYLMESYSNIASGKKQKTLKMTATAIASFMLIATIVMFFTINDNQRIPVLLVATSVIVANMLVMGAVERHLLKNAEPLAGANAN